VEDDGPWGDQATAGSQGDLWASQAGTSAGSAHRGQATGRPEIDAHKLARAFIYLAQQRARKRRGGKKPTWPRESRHRPWISRVLTPRAPPCQAVVRHPGAPGSTVEGGDRRQVS